MSATSQLQTFLDLYTDLMNRTRVTTGVTATDNQAKRYVNVAMHDMHLGQDYKFPWAERTAVLLTHARYTTGTVTITQGSTSLAGASTAWNTATVFGWNNMRTTGKVTIAGRLEPYRVTAVASDTAATLENRFVGSNVSAGAYVYYEDEYDLATDFLRPVDQSSFDLNQEIALLPRGEFYRRYPRNTVPGKPNAAMILDRVPSGNVTPIRRIILAPAPNTVASIGYRYITSNLAVSSTGTLAANLSADTDEPLVPLRYRHAILYHALAAWYRDKKDDVRSQEAWSQYVDLIARITGDVEHGQRTPTLRPQLGSYAASVARPYRSGARRNRAYDLNNAFDEWR